MCLVQLNFKFYLINFSGNSPVLLMATGFPGGSEGKEPACNAGDLGSIPGLGRSPGGGYGNPLQYSCLENPQGERYLAGYSLWGCKRQTRLSSWLQHQTALDGTASETAEHVHVPDFC